MALCLAALGAALSFCGQAPPAEASAARGADAATALLARHGERAPSFHHVKQWRRENGLDLDLADQPAALAARIHNLIRAWQRGAPWARRTNSVWGAPLRKRDLKLMFSRSRYMGDFGESIYGWVARHVEADATFAEYYIDEEAGGLIYVGFTADQNAQVAQLKAELDLLAPPGKVRPFPFQPRYTAAELGALEERIVADESIWELVSGVSTEAKLNKVLVESPHVAKTRALLRALFGPDAPIAVRFGEYAELL